MTPADEITEAVKALRSPNTTTADLARLRGPITKLLNEAAAIHEADLRPGHGGCQWCADEDFPCLDFRNALAVARAVLGATDQQP